MSDAVTRKNRSKNRSWVEVSKSAVLTNLAAFQSALPQHMSVMPVIKGNAYGHGMREVAGILADAAEHFAVVFIEEALELRESGITKPILVFSTVTDDRETLCEAIRKDISFTVYDRHSFTDISEAAAETGKPAHVHVNVDTGMTRLGLRTERSDDPLADICADPHLVLDGIYSHLASPDDTESLREQCRRFDRAVAAAEKAHCKIKYRHILSTGGVMARTEFPGNIVRVGKGICGLALKPDDTFPLRQALAWKTRVIQVRAVGKGVAVGYGGSYVTERDSVLAVLPVGFADGYHRSLSNSGEVLIRGVRCPIRGKVCMNNLIIDVSHVADPQVGDIAVLVGGADGAESGERITPYELAEKAGTVTTEILANITPLLPRFTVE